jgi:hypothetical protein
MSKIASERLLERAKRVNPSSLGISAADIARIPLSDEMVSEITECLSKLDVVSELKWGLSFTLGVLDVNPPQDFLKWLLPKVPIWLKHQDWDVRERALEIFVRLRNNYKNYRESMVEVLQDPEAVVRWRALKEYRTFVSQEDISVLLHFQNDKYMSETEMGSPLVYAIRNDALAAIETLCGKPFRKSEKVGPGEAGRMVYWWDWQPFLDWWGKNQSKVSVTRGAFLTELKH